MQQQVIEAEVIEETIPHAPKGAEGSGQAPKTGDSVLGRIAMLAIVAALGAGVYSLKDPPKPEAVATAYATTHVADRPLNGRALQQDYRKRHISPYTGANDASKNLTETMAKTERKIDEFNQRLERQMVLNEEQFQKYKRRLTDQGYELNDAEARQLLLRAGYRPPQEKTQVASNSRSVEETATFAKSLIGEFVADEVESFLKRADMITRVGVFLAGDEEKR